MDVPRVLQTPLHCAAASTHGAVCLEILVNEHADVIAKVAAIFSDSLLMVIYCLSMSNVMYSFI